MAIKHWDTQTSKIIYRRFEAGESLIDGLESLANAEGIREAAITSCIGRLSQLKPRNAPLAGRLLDAFCANRPPGPTPPRRSG